VGQHYIDRHREKWLEPVRLDIGKGDKDKMHAQQQLNFGLGGIHVHH
jgi:hypothetical protein